MITGVSNKQDRDTFTFRVSFESVHFVVLVYKKTLGGSVSIQNPYHLFLVVVMVSGWAVLPFLFGN